MSSTFILNNTTSTPYRLNTKPVINTHDGVPWPRETYFIKNIVIGPSKKDNVVEANREKHLVDGKTYNLRTLITTKNDNVLCAVWMQIKGTLLSSDIRAKVDNSTGHKTTGWQKNSGSIDTILHGQTYNISFHWVSQTLSLFDNLEVSIVKI